MAAAVRRKVLSVFKSLHRTRREVFAGDDYALTAGRLKINEEFRKHENETDEEKIGQLIQTGMEAEKYLRTMVVQAVLNEDKSTYEVKMRKENERLTNFPYNENFVPLKRARRNKKCGTDDTKS